MRQCGTRKLLRGRDHASWRWPGPEGAVAPQISVMLVHGKPYCMDSLCFHGGGPLTVVRRPRANRHGPAPPGRLLGARVDPSVAPGQGPIEEIDGKTCINCPWHNYKITVETGEKIYQHAEFDKVT